MFGISFWRSKCLCGEVGWTYLLKSEVVVAPCGDSRPIRKDLWLEHSALWGEDWMASIWFAREEQRLGKVVWSSVEQRLGALVNISRAVLDRHTRRGLLWWKSASVLGESESTKTKQTPNQENDLLLRIQETWKILLEPGVWSQLYLRIAWEK